MIRFWVLALVGTAFVALSSGCGGNTVSYDSKGSSPFVAGQDDKLGVVGPSPGGKKKLPDSGTPKPP